MEDVVRAIRLVIQYLQRKCTRKETWDMMELLAKFKIGLGTKVVFHYTVKVGTDTFNRQYHVTCPKCENPSVYFLPDFGPGCSEADGGCGYKVPEEKRPWYTPPYIHEGEIQAPPPKK